MLFRSGIGQAPTGSKDPFALRRSAIGILRLVTENDLDVSIEDLIKLALMIRNPLTHIRERAAVGMPKLLETLVGKER